MCDNFRGGAVDAPPIPQKGKVKMNVELEREYSELKAKVNELREYL